MRLTVIARKRGADAIARKRGADAIGQSQRLLALAKERILATPGRKEQLTKSPSLFLTQQPIANEADTEADNSEPSFCIRSTAECSPRYKKRTKDLTKIR